MKKTFLVLAVVLMTLCAIVAPAFAGGPPQEPQFNLSIQGLPGWETTTSSHMSAIVKPPFYQNGEGSAYFYQPAHSDQFTVGYWENAGQKYAAQTMSQPYPSGNFQWEGFIEVGENDPRQTLSFEWWVETGSNLNWWMQIYRCDTRSLVFRQLIETDASNNWGTINTAISQDGYDILVAAWDPNPVPEPSSVLALVTGFAGFGGFILRRRKK